MKRKKQSIKIIPTIIILLITCVIVYMFLKGKLFSVGTTGQPTEKIITNISQDILYVENGNIYDVEYGQQLKLEDKTLNYETVAKAQIRGEKVTFTNYYSKNGDYKKQNIKNAEGKKCLENNIMAAIISGFETKGHKYFNQEDGKYYSTETQLAIWEFWNKWVESSGAKENGFDKGMGNATITEKANVVIVEEGTENVAIIEKEFNGEEIRKKAQELAMNETYNVNIHFLKYFSHNNDSKLLDNQSNLILVEVLDENGDIIDFSPEIDDNSEVAIQLTSNIEDALKVDEEIIYTVTVYNKSDKNKQNLKVISELSEGLSLVNVTEVQDKTQVELEEGTDYSYNKGTNSLTIDINNLDVATKENEEIVEMDFKQYKITAKTNKLDKGVFIKTIQNSVSIQKENNIILKNTIKNRVSDVFLEVEEDKLPEELQKEQDCVIGLKITNKGLITSENINISISIPEIISMSSYEINVLSENGKVENNNTGTASNEFENNSIVIPGEKTLYFKLYGTVNENQKDQQITIKGNVNNEEVTWTTNVKGGR